jgi:FkbM family methyltransferase
MLLAAYARCGVALASPKKAGNARAAFHTGESPYHMEIAQVGGFEVAFRAGTADEFVLEQSFDHDIFFTGVPEYRPKEDDVIIDVGAHIGTFSLLAASKVPKGRVYAIEASRETFCYLRTNVALNRLTNIDVTQVALSDKAGTTTLFHHEENWGHSIMKQLSARSEIVVTESLSELVARKGIGRIDFMKFNCEGAEFPILMSAPMELLERINMMLVLYHCDLATNASLDALIARLGHAKFATDIRQQTEHRGWLVATRRSG